MRNLISKLGVMAFWAAWPAYFFYLRLSRRTRILLVHDTDVLVIKGWMSDGKWSLPGGGVHRDETVLQGAVRELHEEIGIQLTEKDLRPLGEAMLYRAYGHRYPFYCFIAEAKKDMPIKKQWYEISHAEWVDYRTLNAKNTAPDALTALRIWLG
jgi:8-oxo-dGTP pyrophosphatase MutT (NUDIX family)